MPHEDLSFNQDLAMEIMYLDGQPVLHVVDIGTGFGNAAPLSESTVEVVWATFTSIWATLYPGYPNKLRVDSGSICTSPSWTHCTDEAGIQLQISGVESHNSLGLGERYHSPPRRIFKKIPFDAPGVDFRLVIRLVLSMRLNGT